MIFYNERAEGRGSASQIFPDNANANTVNESLYSHHLRDLSDMSEKTNLSEKKFWLK
jgi:hypothetical protein